MTRSTVLIDRASLSQIQERDLAAHIYAVKWHIGCMIDILSGKARAKWLDYLIREKTNALGRLRSALDEGYPSTAYSPYYGGSDGKSEDCPKPKQ